MKVQYYVADGKEPLKRWLDRLKDKKAHAAILKRIARISIGLLGDHKSVGSGIYELRIDVGAGYRIYFGRSGDHVILLLCGGDKATQQSDISKAKEYWDDYKANN